MSSNTKRFTPKQAILSLIILSILALSSGCSQLVSQRSGEHSVSSSMVDFLYPNKAQRVTKKTEIPSLSLPVKVGIAFLPSQNRRGGLSETAKIKLLQNVKASFGQHRFIDSIQIIPSIYLKQRHGSNGFDTLDQLGRLHDIDIIALVSYDQLTQSLHNNASLLYWTIVGMYVIPGNENSVQTFVDTAVFDIRSRKMLLRAPGISRLSKRSTAIGVDSTMINTSQQGFNLAFDDMIKNLDRELGQLKRRIREGHIVNIKHREAYSGGGSFDSSLLYLLLIGLVTTLRKLINQAAKHHNTISLY